VSFATRHMVALMIGALRLKEIAVITNLT